MIWHARAFSFQFPRPALVMGIVNVTPDSFSDGGKFFAVEAAVEHGLRLVAEGADLLDIGGESTRPGADPVPAEEEWRRVRPVLEQLAARVAVPLSIDTQKPEVARAAVRAGASLINDIAANREDDAMWRVVAETGAGYVAMHMLGTPTTMQHGPAYADVVREVNVFFAGRLERLQSAGVQPGQVALDPGLGFGKTLEHNLQLIARLEEFSAQGRPLVLGASRKAFLGRLLGIEAPAGRLAGALACAALAVRSGAAVLRVHDVRETVQAVRVAEAVQAHARIEPKPIPVR